MLSVGLRWIMVKQ